MKPNALRNSKLLVGASIDLDACARERLLNAFNRQRLLQPTHGKHALAVGEGTTLDTQRKFGDIVP